MEFCSYCSHTGIVVNPDAYELGVSPLMACPRCVDTRCKCKGEAPYLFVNNGAVAECMCRQVRIKIDRINHLYSQSDIDKKYRWNFLSTFKAESPAEKRSLRAANDIVKRFPQIERGLFLWGNPGTGKTLLSTIILTELIVRYAVAGKFMKISRNFFGKLRATFNEGSEFYGKSSDIERELAEIDVLVVDDFGTQKDTAWEQETLYNLVDARYEAEKFTIFTSNVNPIREYQDVAGGRILSRIREMCMIIELSGKDHRIDE